MIFQYYNGITLTVHQIIYLICITNRICNRAKDFLIKSALLKDGIIEHTVDHIQRIMLEKGLIKNSFNSKDILAE